MIGSKWPVLMTGHFCYENGRYFVRFAKTPDEDPKTAVKIAGLETAIG